MQNQGNRPNTPHFNPLPPTLVKPFSIGTPGKLFTYPQPNVMQVKSDTKSCTPTSPKGAPA